MEPACDETPVPEPEAQVLSLNQRLAWAVPTLLLLLLVDQASKLWAVQALAGEPPATYFTVLQLVYAENTGAWGSLGAQWGDGARWLILGLLPALFLVGLGYYTLTDRELGRLEVASCAMILAGGAGNLIDRFRLGYVVDFLYLGYGPIGTNIFNIADAVLMLGLFLLLFRNLRGSEQTEPEPEASGAEPAG